MAAVSQFLKPHHIAGTPCFVQESSIWKTFWSLSIPLAALFFLRGNIMHPQWHPEESVWLQENGGKWGEYLCSLYLYVLFSFSCASSYNPRMCVVFCQVWALNCSVDPKKGPGMAAWAKDAPARQQTRTGLGVIWHTVKDPRNLHSDCVPVGWAELCLSLAMLLLAPIPKLASALLRELEGGPVSEFAVASCHLSLFTTYSSVYTDMFTHTEERSWELS